MIAKLKLEHQKNPDSLDTNRAIAEYYLDHGEEVEAEPYLLKVLELNPEMAPVQNQLGVIYLKLSQYDKAERCFKGALRLDFGITESHFNLAVLYHMQKRYAEALSCYKEVANSDPDDAEVYSLMGDCARSVGMLWESGAFFAESFRLSPTSETAIDLSMVYINAERYSEAEEVLNFLVDLVENGAEEPDSQNPHASSGNLRQTGIPDTMPENTGVSPAVGTPPRLERESLYFALGLVLAKQGKYMDAIRYLRSSVILDDRNEQAYNYLGECCAAVALEKQAESFFAKASRIDPEYLLPIINLGKLYYGQGEYGKAVASFEHYLDVRGEAEDVQGLYSSKTDGHEIGKPENSEAGLARELLGKSYLQLGDKAKAMKVWKKSLNMNPDQPELVSLMETSSDPAYKRNSLSIED